MVLMVGGNERLRDKKLQDIALFTHKITTINTGIWSTVLDEQSVLGGIEY